MKIPTALIALLILLSVAPANAELWQEYKGNSFFDGFDFFTDKDPTDGYVNYVDRGQATSLGLINVNGYGQVKIKGDNSNVTSGRGRDSVRVHSKQRFSSGSISWMFNTYQQFAVLGQLSGLLDQTSQTKERSISSSTSTTPELAKALYTQMDDVRRAIYQPIASLDNGH